MTNSQPHLTGPRVTLRDPHTSDGAALLAVLKEPEVAFWWVGFDEQRVQNELIAEPGTTRIIEVAGQVAGGLIVLRSSDAEYPTTVMHIFLSTAFRGQRLGEETLALAIQHEFASGITRVTLDPNINNGGAIRSYERLGFVKVGVLRDYQVRPSGALEDALFMDMTRSDFPNGPAFPEIADA